MDDAQGGALSWPAFREAIPLLAALQWPPRLRWSLLRSRVLAADVPGALCAECVVDVPATEKLAAAMDGLMGGEEHGGSDSEGGAVAVDAPDVSSVVPRRRRVVHVRLCAAFSATFSAPWLLVSACDTAGAPVPNPQLAALLEPMLRPSEACPIHAMLTEEEHPITGLPCLGLHACETPTWMELVLRTAPPRAASGASAPRALTYLLSWFHAVGGAVVAALGASPRRDGASLGPDAAAPAPATSAPLLSPHEYLELLRGVGSTS